MSKLTIKTGTEDDFFRRGRQLVRAADRGEALPSIASVSRFSLTTRQAGDELGTEIKISGGRPPEIREAGCHRQVCRQ